jgi:hypothetical protein
VRSFSDVDVHNTFMSCCFISLSLYAVIIFCYFINSQFCFVTANLLENGSGGSGMEGA